MSFLPLYLVIIHCEAMTRYFLFQYDDKIINSSDALLSTIDEINSFRNLTQIKTFLGVVNASRDIYQR